MRLYSSLLAACVTLGAAAPVFAAPPQISQLSTTSVPQSGRLRIEGVGFGPPPGLAPDARVEIGGVPVATARWTDTAISAYVTAVVPPGATTVRVVTGEGASDALDVTIDPLPAPQGRVVWTLLIDGMAVRTRVGVAPDASVVAGDVLGHVYCVGQGGQLRWIYDGPRSSAHEYGGADAGPVAIGPDGTAYVGVDPLGPTNELHAVRPDGTRRWVLGDVGTSVSGPAVGPDGDIYWVTSAPGNGVQRISPAGQRLWASPGEPLIDGGWAERSEELILGASTPDGPVDRLYFALTTKSLYQDQGTPPFLYAFDLASDQRFFVHVQSFSGSFGPRGQVAVGPDGTVHLASFAIPEGWGLHSYAPDGQRIGSYLPDPGNIVSAAEVDAAGNLYVMHDGSYMTALGPDGAVRWETTLDPGSKYGPSLSPDGATILIDGMDTAPDGEIAAYTASTGELLWRHAFAADNGTFQAPSARARFSADGATAYVSTAIGGQPAGEEYGYLHALAISEENDETGGETGGESSGDGESSGGGEGGEATTGDAATSDPGSTGEATTGVPDETGADEGDAPTGGSTQVDAGSSSGDAPPEQGDGEGCACRGSDPTGPLAPLLLGLGGLLVRRRRAR